MSKYIDLIGWDDVPHLQPPNISQAELDALEADMLPHQRSARRTGRPALGAGAIYPVDERDLLIKPFPIPEHYERGYAFDVGWKKTAALIAARDPETRCVYLTGEYYRGEQQPIIHAHGIRSMLPFDELIGCIDPAAAGSNQKDGSNLMQEYCDLGLNLVKANNSVDAGLHAVLVLMQAGLLKVFDTLKNFITELRLYRRDEKGKIVKENDHLMDCLRYLIYTANLFMTQPQTRARRGVKYGEW